MKTNDSTRYLKPGDSWARRLSREPLVHFLLIGGLLFGVYYALDGDAEANDARRIVIDETQVASLAAQFQRTWLRPPTHEELVGLVHDRVKEEILYREALALGLDRDDQVVRRRLRQKMEFLSTDLAGPEPPKEAELQAYLDANIDQFQTAGSLTFTQVYLKDGQQERATGLLQKLAGHSPWQVDLDQLGDATLLPGVMQQVNQAEIGRVFGKEFAEARSDAPQEQWSGPYASPYGQHLVYVASRLPAREPKLSDVRTAVAREWQAEQQREANERFYRALRDRYTVKVTYADVAAGDKLVAIER